MPLITPSSGSGLPLIGSSTDNAVTRWDGTAGSAVQNSGVLCDDSNNLTGAISFAVGSTPSLTGALRVANNVTALAGRNAANSADLSLVSLNSSNAATFGNTSGETTVTSLNTITLQNSGTSTIVVQAAQVQFGTNRLTWIRTLTPIIQMGDRLEDGATNLTTFRGQLAFASATGTNRDGGRVTIQGGARSNTNGKRGPVELGLNGVATDLMIEMCDVQAEVTSPSRVAAFLNSSRITTTEMPTGTGDKVIFIANAATAPTVAAVNGSILYSEGAILKNYGGFGVTAGRFLQAQGADIASANDLTLGSDGNTFEITGTTQINAITTTNWVNGSQITLLFTSTPTVKHNTAGGAGTAVILLAGAADFSATAGDTLTLRLSEIGGTQAWREIGRAVI